MKDFEGSLFELHAQGTSSSMIKTVANGLTTFELSSAGHVVMQGLKMVSGGLNISAGGLKVQEI